MATINYSHWEGKSTVNGPGVRTVLWLQGCSIRCGRCQNERLWPTTGGRRAEPVGLAYQLIDWNKLHANSSHLYTITGGEPFDQVENLLVLLTALRHLDPAAHIVVYSGYTWQKLTRPSRTVRYTRLALMLIDVLVDGPYLWDRDNDHMQYVGSENQRVIDIRATLHADQRFDRPWSEDDLVLLDWGTTGMLTIADGGITMAKGWIQDTRLADVGALQDSPRCGESERG